MKSFAQIATETHTDIETVRVAMHMASKTEHDWVCDGYRARTRQSAVEAYLTRHVETVDIWADDYDAVSAEYDAQAECMDAETLNGMSECDRWSLAYDAAAASRLDEAELYRTCTLANPVVIFACAGLWNGTHNDMGIIEPDNIGDIIDGPNPYDDMDGSRFQVNEDDELEYVGTHHDGTNTAIYREWVGDDMPDDVSALTGAELYAHTRALGPDIRRVLGLAA